MDKKRRKHAIHNEQVCDYLLASNEFHDWVVTTAFYAALHFVQSDIFPLTYKKNKYLSLNTFYREITKKTKEFPNTGLQLNW